ncbi:hypothetical protein BJX62DRAFT_253613 [Aspergillus germanicus]
MVGVPGKDGPCTTCRRRKKRCDKKTPFCSQCIAAGLLCEGYHQHHSVWLNSTDGGNRTYAKSAGITEQMMPVGTSRSGGATTTITLHESPARIAREDRYVGLYLAAFLPNGRLFSQEASRISSAGWLRHLDFLCRSERTLRLITLAHGLSMLATRDHDSQLKLKGFEAHRMALQQMHVALQDPKRATGDGILAAVRLFRFYEILYGAQEPNGTRTHTDGEMALFMNRGCHRKWSASGRYLLVSGRIVSFILGVGRRRRSPFSDSDWMTAPWRKTPKSPLDKLTDILVQIPGLLEELDVIRGRAIPASGSNERGSATSDTNKPRVDLLLGKCNRLEKALLAWKDTMRDELQTYDHIHYTSDTNPINNPLPTPQVDRDFAVLHMSCLYWSGSILLYTTIHLATHEAADPEHELQFASFPPSSSAFIIPFSSSPGCPTYYNERNPTLHAHRIIHAMPLSHGPFAGGYGALCSTFPLGIALRYLVVAHLFLHGGDCDSGASGGVSHHHRHAQQRGMEREREFLRKTMSQPFMKAYTARFIGHLHKVNCTPGQCMSEYDEHVPGWYGAELRMRKWWFGEVQ